ncbi:MAG TPA: transposase [Pyrinomonadaceae bacterium]|nr:transposase [Pyrinomonadaceae bacterium]
MTSEERTRVMEYRRLRNLPLHSPPHWAMGFSAQYLVTASCFEHTPIIGKNPARLTECEEQLLAACQRQASKIYAWCVLPNHYHVLLGSRTIKTLCQELGRFHGRSSFNWNGEDGQRGRKVWFRCFDREIRSERHFWATLNYIHHNPVHHGYAQKWQDWIWSSAAKFLESVGRARAAQIWKDYPILDFGKGWDI